MIPIGLITRSVAKHLDKDDSIIDLSKKKNISECFHFEDIRAMYICNIPGTKGSVIFSSLQSYEKFKQDNTKMSLNSNGVGVPLLQIVEVTKGSMTDSLAKFINGLKEFIIYKYILKNDDDPPVYDDAELVKDAGSLKLYKYKFAKVNVLSPLSSSDTSIEIAFENGGVKSFFKPQGDFDTFRTSISGYNASWATRLSSFFVTLDLEVEQDLNKENLHSKGPIVASYTYFDTARLPIGTTKVGKVLVGNDSPLGSYGICDISEQTQLIASQALVLHKLAYLAIIDTSRGRRQKRRRERKLHRRLI